MMGISVGIGLIRKNKLAKLPAASPVAAAVFRAAGFLPTYLPTFQWILTAKCVG